MAEVLTLESIRRIAMRLVVALIVVLALITAVTAALTPLPGKHAATALALLLAIYPCILVAGGRIDAQARLLAAITVVAMPALLLFVCEGAVWQIDLHMLFFALLATTSILCDWKAILAATLVIAVHHLGLGLLAPAWVFGANGSLGRILLHAVILAIEAGTLIWLARAVTALLASNAAQSIAAELASQSLAETKAQQDAEVAVVTGALGGGLKALTDGDLATSIEADFPPAYAVLKRDFNSSIAALGDMIAAVGEGSRAVRIGVSEIGRASDDLAQRTERSAASLQEATNALAEIETRLRDGNERSIKTVARAELATVAVTTGRQTAEVAVAAMGRVSGSAKGIDSVIEGLDKIAFQTRVLAMNAAVEAGRAGDAGRGFAVVADLVSALAMRAEEEAKRARDQLTVTQAEIVTAVSAVQGVDGALATIAGDVDAVHQLLAVMAGDNEAQAGAVTAIATTVGSIDRDTQQNAAMVEETNAAVHTLGAETNALAALTARFRTDATGVGAARPTFATIERLVA